MLFRSSENFFDIEKQKIGVTNICWNLRCKTPIHLPPKFKVGKNVIFLNNDTKLLQHHVKDDYNLKTIFGEVVQNPNDPKKWGIKNVSKEIWTFIKSDGSKILVDKGKAAPISIGAKIDFGNITGEYI